MKLPEWPVATCTTTRCDLTCPQAQLRWGNLIDAWRHVWTQAPALTDPATKAAIFSLQLEFQPDRLWFHPELARLQAPTDDESIATQREVAEVRRRHLLTTMHTIWQWRTTADSTESTWTRVTALAYHDTSLRTVFAGHNRRSRPKAGAFSAHIDAALWALASGVPPTTTRAIDPTRDASDRRYLLCFDGGSRGNPGPGGAGTAVVHVPNDATPARVIWSAAMSLAAISTTNNQAEYQGLLTGLRDAVLRQWSPMEVI